MKTLRPAAALLFLASCSLAQTASPAPAVRKPCDDLKAEIAKKLDAKGISAYTLEIVDKGNEGDAKVVGSCDGGTKSIVYSRTNSTPADSADQKKPE